MDYIGDRISLLQKENELSVVIVSFRDKAKNLFLLIWILLWSLGGLAVISQYFSLTDPGAKTAIIVWLGFWLYFEFKIIIAYRWRKYGKEVIKIRNGKLIYKKDIAGKGKLREYNIDFIKDLRLLEEKENSFFENLNNSYWVIANEKIAFDYNGSEVKLGFQLEIDHARTLLNRLKKELSK